MLEGTDIATRRPEAPINQLFIRDFCVSRQTGTLAWCYRRVASDFVYYGRS